MLIGDRVITIFGKGTIFVEVTMVFGDREFIVRLDEFPSRLTRFRYLNFYEHQLIKETKDVN